MSKKNKNTCVRRGEHQHCHIDNQTVSSVQDSIKPQEVSTKDLTITKESMIMTLTKCLCSLKDAIKIDGIKHILYLLYYFLFDAISSIYLGFEALAKGKYAELCNDNRKKQNKWKQIYQKYKNQRMKNNKKYSFNKTQLPIYVSQDTKSCANERSNVIQDSPKSYTQKEGSNFRKRTNSFCSSNFPNDSQFASSSLIKKKIEQKKQLSVKFAPTNGKKQVRFTDEQNEKHTEWRNEKRTEKENYDFQQRSPIKYKPHSSRISMRTEELKENNLKYKETDTQTDSVFSTGNDVKMVSVGTNYPEQQFYTCATNKSQDKDMNQKKVNYVPNDEVSEERLYEVAYQLIMSNISSSSPVDLGLDEHKSAPPNTDIAANPWSTKLSNGTNTFGTSIRPPPGFPEIPQHPPLIFNASNDEYSMPSSIKDYYNPNSHIKPMKPVPPEPPRMQDHYYNNPQYMEAQ